VKIRPAKRLRGRLSVPGDKSISHRAGIIGALARGRTTVSNFSTSADCASTLEALRGLGVGVEREGHVVRIEGAGVLQGATEFQPPAHPLDCGNSGTTMRLLAGVLAAQSFAATLAGDESLSRRPMRRIIEPLELMGAHIASVDGHAPLRVEGRRPLRAIRYEMPVASAQVKSCILLAGLGAEGRTQVVEPLAQTRDHTERMLRWFGADVKTSDLPPPMTPEGLRAVVTLEGRVALVARDLTVPGDISSAAFFLAAAAILPGSELELTGVGLNETRTGVLRSLVALGADLRVEDRHEQCREFVGDLRVRGACGLAPRPEGANVLRGASIAQLIDELPVLAVLGTQVEGGLEIRDARELRVKESDRISATASNLRAMGAEVEEFEDGLRVGGPVRLRGARLDSCGDHRIAMAFAVAALAASGESEIEGAAECVRISFPEFFALLETVTER
jgi:3-phosphoshikimate 1-carboxyvinyltransferase